MFYLSKNFIAKTSVFFTASILFSVLIGFFSFSPLSYAVGSGPLSPGTVTDDSSVGNRTWINPGNVAANDTTYATVSTIAGTSHYLNAQNFGFSIPLTATINGIVVEIERKCSAVGVLDICRDATVKLVKGGTVQGNNNGATATNWPTTEAYATYGTSSDLWGLGLTPTDVNASNFGVVLNAQIAADIPETASVDHIRMTVYYTSAPSITAGPSDGGSYSGAPTDVGNNVTFTATATDAESNNYYLAICKTNAITANSNGAPTCDGGNWCVSSSTASGSQASCNYTAVSGSAESNAWYGFLCDHNPNSLCSVSSQGSGNPGSPFAVNHTPSFSAISNNAGAIAPGSAVTFTSTASDSDTDGTPDAVAVYVCKANDFSSAACGAGGEWCHSSLTSSNPTCAYTVQSGDGNGSYTYYANIIDSHSLASASNPRLSSFGTDITAPIITLNGSGAMSVSFSSVFSDPGASATDNTDGNITSQIVKTGSVNTLAQGTYQLNYNVSDAAGNHAVQVTRTVTVSSGGGSGGSSGSGGSGGGGNGGNQIPIPPVTPLPTSDVTPTTSSSIQCSYLLTRYLGFGDKGEDVLKLQQILAQMGFFSVAPTGYYGPVTFQSVKNFQRAHTINPVGVVGPITKDAINKTQCVITVTTVPLTQIPTLPNTGEVSSPELVPFFLNTNMLMIALAVLVIGLIMVVAIMLIARKMLGG